MGAWTTLRNEMKNGQINSQPGKLLTTNFYAMMNKYGVKLSISEMGAVVRAFRGLGMQDVIKYNDFCVCASLQGTANEISVNKNNILRSKCIQTRQA